MFSTFGIMKNGIDYTSVRLRTDTKKDLERFLRRKGETYDDLIRKLIQKAGDLDEDTK